MKLSHSSDHGAPVAIVAIYELVANIFAALPKCFANREFLDSGIQVLLRHSGIQRELAPNGTIQGQSDANVLAI